MSLIASLGAFAAVVAAHAATIPLAADDVWDEIATPVEISLPAPLDRVVWRTDLDAAVKEATSTGRPLFVTFRCLPCNQCADFDADVLEGSPMLTPLLSQFVTVRLTDAKQLDLSIFPARGFQDFDLSWWGYFMSPERRVYAVFGGKDHVSDTTRISTEALANSMRRVLSHHYDPRREGWSIDGPSPKASPVLPTELPGYQSWVSKSPSTPESCLHCHQVSEILRQPAIDAGRFDAGVDLAIWPLPENVGIELDRDHGLLVRHVEDGSAAHAAGLQAGDELLGAGSRRLFGQADFRAVLHRLANPSGSIPLRWLRDGRLMRGSLELGEGWRETIIWWRASVSGGNIGAGPGFAWPLARRGATVESGRMAVEPWFGPDATQWVSYQAGLRPRHTIIAVGGESPDVIAREFMTWFRLRYGPGDEVVLTVLDNGEEKEIRYRLPE